MSRRLAFAGFIAATLAVGAGLLFALDAGARLITGNAAARAFILSDAFWPAAIGFTLALLAVLLGAASSFTFHPDRPSGRTASEVAE